MYVARLITRPKKIATPNVIVGPTKLTRYPKLAGHKVITAIRPCRILNNGIETLPACQKGSKPAKEGRRPL